MNTTQSSTVYRRSNLLVLSTHPDFHQKHIRLAISEALNNREKILIVTDSAKLYTTFRTYSTSVPQGRVRVMNDLAIAIMPDNKPFLAFQTWDMIVTTPDYLRHHLTAPEPLIAESEFHKVGLVVFDSCNAPTSPSVQALIELALIQFCLYPLDGIVRRAIVTMNPIRNGTALAAWLRADIATDATATSVDSRFVSVWDRAHREDILVTFLASQNRTSPELVAQLAHRGYNADATTFNSALQGLRTLGPISTASDLTPLGHTMARFGLSLRDAKHLQRGLETTHLSWLDFLLVAAATPDFPVTVVSTSAESRFVVQTLTSLRSTLLQVENRKALGQVGIKPARLDSVLKIALIGYLTTRNWSPDRIAKALDIPESQVTQAISALRGRVRAMFILAAESDDLPLATRIQALWHMLTGIAPHFAGLAALPNVRHWVLAHLLHAGVVTLTDLINLTSAQYPATINAGLMEHLQTQAKDLLRLHPSEAAFVASFTQDFPVIGDGVAMQLAA